MRSGSSTPRPPATDPPAPRAAHGGQHREARRGRERAAVDRAEAVEERAGPHAPDEHAEGRGGGEVRPPSRRHGSTSRSAWSTVGLVRRLREPPLAIGAGLGGQLGLLLAGGVDPPAEPRGHQLGVGRTEVPRARPDEHLAAQRVERGGNRVRAEPAVAALVRVERHAERHVERLGRREAHATGDGHRDEDAVPAARAEHPAQLVRGEHVEQRRGDDEARARRGRPAPAA